MKKVNITLVASLVFFIAGVIYLDARFCLTRQDLLMIIYLYLVTIGSILLLFQLRSSLNYQRRKAATDFIFGPIITSLLPIEKDLKAALRKPFLVFNEGDHLLTLISSPGCNNVEEIIKNVIDMLNFYERMAMTILKGALDEDICYDDKGLILTNFESWCHTYIEKLRAEVDRRLYVNFSELAARWNKRRARQRMRRRFAAIGKRDIF